LFKLITINKIRDSSPPKNKGRIYHDPAFFLENKGCFASPYSKPRPFPTHSRGLNSRGLIHQALNSRAALRSRKVINWGWRMGGGWDSGTGFPACWLDHFKTLYTVINMEETITIIMAKNIFTNIRVNIAELGKLAKYKANILTNKLAVIDKVSDQINFLILLPAGLSLRS
jgi:hypothetical protein